MIFVSKDSALWNISLFVLFCFVLLFLSFSYKMPVFYVIDRCSINRKMYFIQNNVSNLHDFKTKLIVVDCYGLLSSPSFGSFLHFVLMVTISSKKRFCSYSTSVEQLKYEKKMCLD